MCVEECQNVWHVSCVSPQKVSFLTIFNIFLYILSIFSIFCSNLCVLYSRKPHFILDLFIFYRIIRVSAANEYNAFLWRTNG
jgi:hypothetical protein